MYPTAYNAYFQLIFASESFVPPALQFSGHLQTIVPGLMRRVHGVQYVRERIATPDDDFLDLDWIRKGHRRLVVLTHGLEGSSERQYMRGMAKLFSQNNWDVLAWNCRSCSGEMNRAFRLYHHGDIEDIGTVINHALQGNAYNQLVLIGFSMGGNITMKYMGVKGADAPLQVKGAVTFSAPADLEHGSLMLDNWDNALYRVRFRRSIIAKVQVKATRFPGTIDLSKLKSVQKWRDFDEYFSAPMCGYRSADEFYHNSSAKNFVGNTKRPTLLISALNDPILSPECFPIDLAKTHPYFHLEMPTSGGHCGFMMHNDTEFAWSEYRALQFCETLTSTL